MKKIIIAAVARNGIIGKDDGSMPWHVKEEFKHFKETTFGFPLIMGRVTFESLGKPLPGRTNVVITSNRKFKTQFDEVKIFYDLSAAFSFCESQHYDKCFITGGAKIYQLTLNYADEMILSFMKFDAEGSIYFPRFEESAWKVLERKNHDRFEVVHYARRNA